jgi:hypothetical protein
MKYISLTIALLLIAIGYNSATQAPATVGYMKSHIIAGLTFVLVGAAWFGYTIRLKKK